MRIGAKLEVLPMEAEERLDVLDEERQRIALKRGRISSIRWLGSDSRRLARLLSATPTRRR